MSSSGSFVKLNIGGTVFQTAKSTLTKYDGFFKTMLETDVPISKDSSDCIFIDRSPKHFEKILNYMRDGEVDLPESEEDVKEIRKEARFYLLDGLVDKCKPKRVLKYLEDGMENAIKTIIESNKKGVIIIYYRTENGFIHSSQIAYIIDAYSDEFDVYLSQGLSDDLYDPRFNLHDKKTGQIHAGSIYEFSDFMKDQYGNRK